MDKVLFAVLKKITPSKTQEKEMESIKEKILSAADSVIKPLNLSRTLAGSLMRNTWLPDKKEIDVFIEFPKEISRDDLEKQGLEIGKKIVKKLKAADPEIVIGTDIIVGFPGETEAEFLETVKLVKSIDFKVGFVAMYSPRPGTAAWRMYEDDVPYKVKKKRWQILDELINQKHLDERPKIV